MSNSQRKQIQRNLLTVTSAHKSKYRSGGEAAGGGKRAWVQTSTFNKKSYHSPFLQIEFYYFMKQTCDQYDNKNSEWGGQKNTASCIKQLKVTVSGKRSLLMLSCLKVLKGEKVSWIYLSSFAVAMEVMVVMVVMVMVGTVMSLKMGCVTPE